MQDKRLHSLATDEMLSIAVKINRTVVDGKEQVDALCPHHILWAIVLHQESDAWKALSANRVTPQRFQKVFQETVVDRGRCGTDTGTYTALRSCAQSAALLNGRKLIEPHDFLQAIMTMPANLAYEILVRLGVDIEVLKQDIRKINAVSHRVRTAV